MIPPLMPTYQPVDLAFERGEGAYLYAADGRRYLDFISGIGVTGLGHGHPRLVAALVEQGKKLWHCSNLFRIPAAERLAERLVAHSFADTVFLCNSGTEAVECGIKLVRKHYDAKGEPRRYRLIVCRDAFHGRSLAAVSAGGQAKHLAGFEPAVEGFDRVAFGNLNETRAAIGEATAGILVEPVQGEGGVRPASPEYLRGLRAIADEYGLLLFFDEVQCGMGRTGRLFAHEWAGVRPDVVSVAKSIGGGFPLGACLATEEAASGMTAGSHGSTFGGNPLAAAVGNAVLDVLLADGFLARVRERAASLTRRLEGQAARHPRIVAEVRGLGLMLGLKCHVPNREVVRRARAGGLLLAGAGDNVVRLLPPLIIEEAHVEEALGILGRVFREIEGEGGGP